jgi:hypothetical protein
MSIRTLAIGALLGCGLLSSWMPGLAQDEAPGSKTFEGSCDLIGEALHDLQLRTDDRMVHLFRRAGDRFRAVTSEADWLTYNGDLRGNRYTALTQINKDTVGRLAPAWLFSVPDAGQLQVTPVVADGIMYVTARNELFALDAGSGRRIWHYKRPHTKGVTQGHANRGRRRGRGSRLHDDGSRPPHCLESFHRRAALGYAAR